jgi:hypothetical protein
MSRPSRIRLGTVTAPAFADTNPFDIVIASGITTVTITGVVAAEPALTTGVIDVTDYILSVTIDLVDESSVPVANLTNLKWAWFDQVTPDLLIAPTDQAATGTTDASGVFTVQLPNSTLTAGQLGYLLVSDTDGTEVEAPPQKAFAGPAVVA